MCPLRIVPQPIDKIDKRKPPEPDILCETETEGEIAFELTQLVDKDYSQSLSDNLTIRKAFDSEIERLGSAKNERFNSLYKGASIKADFHPKTSCAVCTGTIPKLVDFLLERPQSIRGFVELPAPLRKVICELHICRDSADDPAGLFLFNLANGCEVSDPTRDQISKKFKRDKYTSSVPVELLAYYEIQPVFPNAFWLCPLKKYVHNNLQSSPFRRVWIFDWKTKAILFEFPEWNNGQDVGLKDM